MLQQGLGVCARSPVVWAFGQARSCVGEMPTDKPERRDCGPNAIPEPSRSLLLKTARSWLSCS